MSLGLGNCSPWVTVAMHSRWSPGCARSVCCSVYCSTSAVDLALWVVLMFPCVEEMKRPVALSGRRGGSFCVLAAWRRKSLKAETLRMRCSHNCSEQTGLRRVPGWLLRCRALGRRQAWVECQCWAGSWALLPHLQQCFELLLCKGNKCCYNSDMFHHPSKERFFCGENRIFSPEIYRPAATSAGVVSFLLKSLFICLFHLLLILCTNLSAWKDFQDILAPWYEINATP